MITTATGESAGRMRVLLNEDSADMARIVSFYLKNLCNTEVLVCR